MGLLDYLNARRRGRRDSRPGVAGGGSILHVELRAKRPGDLTALDRLDLPAGRLVSSAGHPEAGPVAWLSDGSGDQAALWTTLAVQFPDTGLWPLAAETLAGDGSRPWERGEFTGPGSIVRDAGQVLRPRGVEVPGRTSQTRRVELRSPGWAAQILLVPVMRPADAPAQLGWSGTVNSNLDGGDVSAVLRSWENRFGAVLSGLGFDTLTLIVAQPPTEPTEIRQVMQEIYAFCPDIVTQGTGDIGGLDPMVRGKEWSLWWD